MTRNSVSPLHIEWSPSWVRIINIATGQTAEAATLPQMASILSGHRQVLVGVGHRMVFLKSVRLPRAAPDDLRRILSVQLGQLFPLPADQLSFGFLQTGDQNAEGWLTVVAAMRADDVRQIRAALKPLCLTASRILPMSLAAPIIAARAGLSKALVVERGPAGLALDVVEDGVVRFSRIAPEDGDIAGEARRTLTAAHVGDAPLVAVGALDLPDAVPGMDTALSVLHEAPLFHFALTEDLIAAARKRIAARTRLALLLMAAAILLVTLVWADRRAAQASLLRSQGAWARQLARDRSIRDAETDKAAQVIAVQDTLDQAYHPAQPLSDIEAVVGDSLPAGAWLTGLTIERGKPLQARGTARTAGDVARFVDSLGASTRFRDVRIVFANGARIGKIPVVQFNVSAVCVGNPPLPAPAKPGRSVAASSQSEVPGGTGAGA